MALSACGAPVGGAAQREQNAPGKRNGNAATNAGRSAGLNTTGVSRPSLPQPVVAVCCNEADRILR